MGREVRRVPADWQHPKRVVQGLNGPVECYKPLFPGERYQPAVDSWDDEWEGERPDRDDYMPNWPAEERTHLMMYENTSEGTPLGPAFATPEELARWLTDNGASWFGSTTGTYEDWLRLARRGAAVTR